MTIDGYPFDLVETEQHDMTAEVTKHPVESGSTISDHVILTARELTLTNAVVSNTPLGAIAQDVTRLSGTPSRYAYDRLEGIFLAKQSVTVITGLKKYENMILDKLSIPVDHKTSGGIIFTIHLTQITIVMNRRVTVAVPGLRGLGTKKPDLGIKPSDAWGKREGIKGSVFVISFERSLGKGTPILIDHTPPDPSFSKTVEWAHYQVQGDTQPDGYVKAGVYYPMAFGGSVIPKDQFGNARTHSKIGDKPVHYSYQDQQWHSDNDHSVVKVPPGGNDPWKTTTEEGPDPNAQQGANTSDLIDAFQGGANKGRGG